MAKMFKVNEWASGFDVEHIPSGKTHWMGDGVDTLFDENDKAMSPGTEGFVECWEDSLNENREETLEAYFPELNVNEQTEAGYDKLASGWIGG